MSSSYLRQDLSAEVEVDTLLEWAQDLAAGAAPEDVYRNKEGRKTLRFGLGEKSYFLKSHTGVGWGEIFKNLFQLRLPILGASNEYKAVEALQSIGVDTMEVAAFASRGLNPATRQSMIVTDDLVGTISLEDYCADWAKQPPPFQVRLQLLLKLAQAAGQMHRAGINHRDFYICHFHLAPQTLNSGPLRCHLIDLHRAQIRAATPLRWQVKDLAGLYFSAMDCGLSRRDLLRFMRHYHCGGLREALGPSAKMWRKVERAATALYAREHGSAPPRLTDGG